MKLLNEKKITMKDANVLILGVAYKQDIDDMRESPALKVIEHLEKYGAIVNYNDPYIPKFSNRKKNYLSVEITAELLNNADITIITTMHTSYNYQFIVDHSQIVFDTKNATKGLENKENKIYVL